MWEGVEKGNTRKRQCNDAEAWEEATMKEYGTIVVQLYTAQGAIPVPDASVVISLVDGDATKLLAYRITDESGLTTPIEVETPPKELTTRTDDKRGYTNCNIQVSHAKYYNMMIRNVQVFSTFETLQQVEMIPLGEFTLPSDRQKTYEITPQNL